jgi:hypothetical protein
MAPKKRNLSGVTNVTTSSKKSNKHQVVVKKKTRDIPWLAVAVSGVLLVGAVVLGVLAFQSSHQGGQAQLTGTPIRGITCGGEVTVVHYHAHLDMINTASGAMKVPAQVGFASNGSCLYWLHTHDATGLIHIEAPKSAASRVFTLGDFFAVWGQPLDDKDLGNFKLSGTEKLWVYIDGKPWTGKVADAPLKAHEEIAVIITPDTTAPATKDIPTSFNFPSGT